MSALERGRIDNQLADVVGRVVVRLIIALSGGVQFPHHASGVGQVVVEESDLLDYQLHLPCQFE
ncbi:hypothetical protein ACQP2U_42625 (plasmid) [Nocardia sp. CA-084685]|uniref:hypothetical protein n=1 Tax=Nocardia sp. CA-084685 TaxID=3239970 RepID=UPI003D95D222